MSTHSDLHRHLVLRWAQRPRWGWFLRAETFITLITDRLAPRGFYVLDEPESALSFHGQLQLLRFINDAVAAGSQFILATHSPLLTGAAGATILELGPSGLAERAYDDVESVGLWRRFLAAPERILDVLYADDPSAADSDGDR